MTAATTREYKEKGSHDEIREEQHDTLEHGRKTKNYFGETWKMQQTKRMDGKKEK
jgi:hypothetical protein